MGSDYQQQKEAEFYQQLKKAELVVDKLFEAEKALSNSFPLGQENEAVKWIKKALLFSHTNRLRSLKDSMLDIVKRWSEIRIGKKGTKTLTQQVASLHPAIYDTDDNITYFFDAGTYKDEENGGYLWLAGYFSEETDAWWCVGRGKTMYQAIVHLKRQLSHREPNEHRL